MQGTQSDTSYQTAKDVFEFESSMSFEDFINHIWEYPHTIYEDIHKATNRFYFIQKLRQILCNRKLGMR